MLCKLDQQNAPGFMEHDWWSLGPDSQISSKNYATHASTLPLSMATKSANFTMSCTTIHLIFTEEN
jgi:hypothetical protein